MKIQIVILLTLALLTWGATGASQCHSPGAIAIEEQGDSLEIYHSSLPWPCVPPEWERVVWWQACNPFNHQERYPIDTLDVGEPLRVPVAGAGWRAIWAQYQYAAPELETAGAAAMSSNTVYWITPDAPQAAMQVTPNPNDGQFEIKCSTNAWKQRVRIYGPLGLVWNKWLYGDCSEPVTLLSLNPGGIYTVVTDWYFDDDCTEMARTRQSFLVIR